MERIVYHQREKDFGDWEVMIMSPPLIFANESTASLFLSFNTKTLIEDSSGSCGIEKFIGWGNPELLFHLKTGPLNMFIDCTFKTVPRGFYQLLILMVYLPAYETFVPMFYGLMESKKYNAYKYVLSHLVFQTDWKLMPKTITCDFEKPLLKAIEEEFGKDDVCIKACEFHWKQALRRKLIEFGIPVKEVSELVGERGKINILLIIPIDEIISKGIPFVRNQVDEKQYQLAYNNFWNYFIKTWMKDYNPKLWNLNAYSGMDDILINRTNNPLERYNRRLNELLAPHPTMPNFVHAIKNDSLYYVQLLKDIQRKMVKPNNHKPVEIPNIPEDYVAYEISEIVEQPKKRLALRSEK